MSDGQNGTPDQGGAPAQRGDGRTARPSQPASARAPWERVPAVPISPVAALLPSGPPTGNHSEGVAVADLIAIYSQPAKPRSGGGAG